MWSSREGPSPSVVTESPRKYDMTIVRAALGRVPCATKPIRPVVTTHGPGYSVTLWRAGRSMTDRRWGGPRGSSHNCHIILSKRFTESHPPLVTKSLPLGPFPMPRFYKQPLLQPLRPFIMAGLRLNRTVYGNPGDVVPYRTHGREWTLILIIPYCNSGGAASQPACGPR
jgi:hypothetical protein